MPAAGRWLCMGCGRRYARPRRLRSSGGLVSGECWSCGDDMHHAIAPIQGNAFEGKSLVQTMLERARMPGPKDWSPRGRRP